jgi:cell division protein FtsW (lipid II flippase)
MRSSKQVFSRVLKRGLALDIIFLFVLYSTSHTEFQILAAHLIAVLSVAIVILLACYFAMGVEHKEQEQWLETTKASIHQPLRSKFDEKVVQLGQERRKYRRS